jgi:HEXXH motif-containing protein
MPFLTPGLAGSMTGENPLPALDHLRAAELGKHKALLAFIMRTGVPAIGDDGQRALVLPYRLLREVEAHAPDIVTELIGTPQFGAWASDCVRRIRAGQADRAYPAEIPGATGAPLSTDLGHLAVFAATAALRAGHRAELEIPLRDGTVSFPGTGIAEPGARARWEWASFRDPGPAGQECLVTSSASAVPIPREGWPRGARLAAWKGLPRIAAVTSGLRLDAVLDDADPFLDRFAGPRIRVASDDVPAWREMVTAAWTILAGDHAPLAALVAATIRTLVPLARPAPTRPAGSADIASFGAVGLALPDDAVSMAEELVHQAHHSALGALMDAEKLVQEGGGFLGYAPWRDDPRPPVALLQGIFAHYGMGQFWAGRYRGGPEAERFAAAVAFGRLRAMTGLAARELARCGALTEAGQEFLARIQGDVATWGEEPVPPAAQAHVRELGAEHEARWRLAHLAPDPDAVAALAHAFRLGAAPSDAPDAVPSRLVPGPLPPAAANMRSHLLSLRYRNPGQLRRLLAADDLGIDPADAALARGDAAEAASGFRGRIAAGPDPDAWTGLVTARLRTGPAQAAMLMAERPELLMALHERLRDQGARAGPDELAAWLSREDW